MDKIKVVTDTECYINYWLCSFKRLDTGKFLEFEMHEDQDLDRDNLRRILESNKYEFITFNGSKYDAPMIRHALYGASCADLKRASDALIVEGVTSWNFPKKFGCVELDMNHIDVIEVAKGDCSLKLYAGRLHAQKMQDLPIEPSAVITPEQRIELKTYCRNDLENTELLFTQLIPQIDQRRLMSTQYGIDLRSKSDAQIAEAVIKSEVEKATGVKVRKTGMEYREFFYDIPEFVTFKSEQLNNALEILRTNMFTVKDNGVVQMPEALADLQISIGESVYQMGLGGLHSTEKERATVASEEMICQDIDVSSYYPALMINNGLSPSACGDAFMDIYRGIRDKRLESKHRMGELTKEIKNIENMLTALSESDNL